MRLGETVTVHRFKPGEVSNPLGKPKGGFSFDGNLRKYLNTHKTQGEKIITKLIQTAQAGDFRAATYLWDRIDGKALEHQEIRAELPVTLILQPPASPKLELGRPTLAPLVIDTEARQLPGPGAIKEDGA